MLIGYYFHVADVRCSLCVGVCKGVALHPICCTHNVWIRILANQEICVHIRRSQRLRLTGIPYLYCFDTYFSKSGDLRPYQT